MAGVFVDTWGWIALLDQADTAHEGVRQLLLDTASTLTPVVTSWAVIGELFTFAASKRGREAWGTERGGRIVRPVLETLADADVVREVINPTDAEWQEALRLRLKHRSIGDLSLVDCSIPVVCRSRGIVEVVSGDEHLRVVFPGVRLLPGDPAS